MPLVHLDTDLGGDIDDICALALLLRWPEVEIAGITTVTEHDGKRAGYVREALRLAGRDDLAVAAGADVALGRFRLEGGLPPEDRYWPEPVPAAPGPLDAALDLLEQSIARGAIVIGIGPFTNLALLEARRPGVLRRARLFLMGGCVRPAPAGFPAWDFTMDYNVQADAAAALAVLDASSPTLVPIEITEQTALRRAQLPHLRRAGPLGALLAGQAEAFAASERMEERYGRSCSGLPADIVNFLHDPLAVAVALGWEGAAVERTPLGWRMAGEWLRIEEWPDGRPTPLVAAVDGARFGQFWLERVAAI